MVWSGLLIWAADFLFVYVFAALACARGYSSAEIAGMRVVPFAAVTASVLAFTLTLLSMRISWRRLRRAPAQDSNAIFIHFLAVALGALGLLAIVWNLLPAIVLSSDCAG